MGRPVRMLGTHTDIDREKQAQARIDRLTGLYSALSQTGQAMVRAADPQGLYRDVCRIAVEQGRLSMAWVGTVDAAHDEVVPVASFGDGTGYAEHARIVLDAAQPEGRGPAALSIRNGQHYVCNDFDADPATMPWRERARAAGFHAVASFPLWREGSAIAVLNLYSDQLGYFDEDIVELLDRMVSDLGLALDRFALNERRAAAEQRLRHSESRLTEAQRIARIGSWEYVFATDRMGFSEQTFDLFGIDPTPDASLPRAQFQQLIHPADRELVQREFERAVTQRSTFETVHRIALHDGSASHVHVRGEIEYDDAGAPHSARGTVQDVSQHVLAEAALRESESRFRHLLASLDDVVWAAAIEDGRMLYISEAAERVYGWPMDAFFGDPQIWLRAVLPADQEHVHEAFDALAASGHAECEYRIVRGDGEVRWLHERRSVIRDEAGAPGRIAGIASDITARKQAEERLRASEESFRALASVSPVGIFRTDARGACLYVNRKWCEIAGMEEDQAHGHGWERALHPDDRLPVTIEWYAAAARGGFYLDECRFQRPGGGVTWVISQATPEHDENGDVIGYVGCLTDINERKAAEEALRASSLRIEALSRRMLQLQEEERRALARELHDEVGQQLGALRLNLDALRRGLSDGVAQGRLTDCAEIVDTTIAQIRDRALDLRPAVLDDLGLKPALDSYGKRQAMRSGCAIEVKASPLPSNATGEQQSALFRIAQESVNNALRHSQASRIEIAVRFEEGASVLSVRDDGIGFDVGATLAREYTGTGLGLPGMRERAELLGGTFEIRSEPGAGTEVVARIPVEPQA
jgi:PAS domain S-box-containing protein